jgi:hypothetical protein
MSLEELTLIALVLGAVASTLFILTFLTQFITLLARGLYELRMWVQRQIRQLRQRRQMRRRPRFS